MEGRVNKGDLTTMRRTYLALVRGRLASEHLVSALEYLTKEVSDGPGLTVCRYLPGFGAGASGFGASGFGAGVSERN